MPREKPTQQQLTPPHLPKTHAPHRHRTHTALKELPPIERPDPDNVESPASGQKPSSATASDPTASPSTPQTGSPKSPTTPRTPGAVANANIRAANKREAALTAALHDDEPERHHETITITNSNTAADDIDTALDTCAPADADLSHLAKLKANMAASNISSQLRIRQMSRTQAKTIEAATQATGSLPAAINANANAAATKLTGVDALVLSPSRSAVTATREALAGAMFELKVSRDTHNTKRERCQHALAVGMCAATDLTSFIDNDDGSLTEPERSSAKERLHEHNTCSISFDKLDAALALSYSSAQKLPP